MTKAIQLNAFGTLTATLVPSDTTLTLDTQMGVTDSYFVLQNTLDPKQIEWVGYTWITNNGDGTYTYNNLVRYLSPVLSTTMGTSPYTWTIGTTATIVPMPNMFVNSWLLPVTPSYTTQTGDFTLSLDMAQHRVPCSSSWTIYVLVPASSVVSFPIDTQIDFVRNGTGAVSFTKDLIWPTVTINSDSWNVSIKNQYDGVSLIYNGSNTWWLFGNLSA